MTSEEKTEREIMREHIVWLSNELVETRNQVRQRNDIMRELLDPELYGWSVPQDIRSRIYNLFMYELDNEKNQYNRK